MSASEGKASQLKDRMHIGSIVHRLSGTERQVLDVTLASLQACDGMRVVADVAATRGSHLPRTQNILCSTWLR
jgi:hypothetical protein